ncbi:Ger(x)C family spore germination protein [Lysinibacillus sp. 3P01SB]|uniref:Ger(x)C family spore germination protein n=1 Tax=Lysinibacillus sp. 3P01SB TaxID=3132284 RepID=UPI0039A72409
MPNKQAKTNLAFLLLVPLLLLLTGCEFKDIDKDVFVSMIAIDQSDNPDKPYKITLKLYEPTGSFKEAQKPEYSYLTQNGESLSEAIRLLESYSDKELEFGHSKLIVLGEDLVKDDKNKEVLDFLIRRPDIQMISWMAVGRPSAEEIIKMVPQGESAAYPELFNYFDDNGTESQYIVTTYLFNLRRNLKEEGISPILPVIRINEEDSHFEINKSLILETGKEPHELDFLDTAIFNMLSQKANTAELVVNEEGEYFIAKIDSSKTKQKLKVQSDNNLKLDIEVSLYGYISESKNALKSQLLPHYNELLKTEAEEKLMEFFDKTVKQGYDPLGFGIQYKAQTLHNKRMSNKEWEEAYKSAEINVTVKAALKSTGSIQ